MVTEGGVAVALDPTFAQACLAHEIDAQMQQTFAQNVWEHMGNKGPMTPGNFLHFHEGLLLAGIYYKPGEGVWLTIDQSTYNSVFPVMYYSHNADFLASDRLWLLHAFGAWAEGACVLLNWG